MFMAREQMKKTRKMFQNEIWDTDEREIPLVEENIGKECMVMDRGDM